MSQFNVNEIFDKDGNDGAVLHGVASAPGGMNFRNRIINGDMRIDARNAGASVTPAASNAYYLDRWKLFGSQTNKFNVGQNLGLVTPPAGFEKYLGLSVASSVSVGASDYFLIGQQIEGNNVSDLGFGSSNAKTVTISFWVRSSLTGTFGAVLENDAQDRAYPFTYTISVADTWEYKTVTIPGDTTGTWLTNNGTGFFVLFGLGAGSNFNKTAGAWVGSQALGVTGAVSVIGTLNATWYITGVQLEVGSVASPFERRPYGTELALCQRYYEKNSDTIYRGLVVTYSTLSGTTVEGAPFLVEKRATPSMTIYGSNGAVNNVSYHNSGATNFAVSSVTAYTKHFSRIIVSTTMSRYATYYYEADAEL